ncbi:MAG: hypothetical protein U0414_28350 [Polyangiaceae bacterium]
MDTELDPESVLVVHDARSRACDALLSRLAVAMHRDPSDFRVVMSAQAAAESLRASARGESEVRLALVCLDLQPAPRAGSRIAEFAAAQGIPVVLVTRSTRWLPEGSPLTALPWIPPDASIVDILDAISRAIELASAPESDALDRVSIGF